MADELIKKLNDIEVPSLDKIIESVAKNKINCEKSLDGAFELKRYESVLKDKLEEIMGNVYCLKDRIIDIFNQYEEYNVYKYLNGLDVDPSDVFRTKGIKSSKKLFDISNRENNLSYEGYSIIKEQKEKRFFKNLIRKRASEEYIVNINGPGCKILELIFSNDSKKNIKIGSNFNWYHFIRGDSPEEFIEKIVKSNVDNIMANTDIYFDFVPNFLNEMPNWLVYAQKNLKKKFSEKVKKISDCRTGLEGIRPADFENL